MSIETLIKRAMADAGLKPEKEIEKKATGNKLADDLYALASECERLGNARVGAEKSGSEQGCLRDLTKAYLFQRMLKSAVEDRLGIVNTEIEKSAGENGTDIRVEYLKAFEKRAADMPEATRGEMVVHGVGAGARRGAEAGAVAGLISTFITAMDPVARKLRSTRYAIPALSAVGALSGASYGALHGSLRDKNKYLIQREKMDITGQLDYLRKRNKMLEGFKGKAAMEKEAGPVQAIKNFFTTGGGRCKP